MAEAAEKTPVKSEEKGIERAHAEWSPLGNLRREFDRMLDEFPWGWRRPIPRSLFDVEPFWRGVSGFGAVPAVDIAEKEKEYEITAELPGMDESNIDVKFADGVLTIKGEKKEEKEEKKKDYYLLSAVMAPSSAAFRFRKAWMPTKSRRRSSTACSR
jgi:HSP20 family protein